MLKLTRASSGLAPKEYAFLKSLSSPMRIQDYLDTLPFNHEHSGETYRSPKRVLAAGKAHCFEGALLAAAALWIAGEPPLIMNLSARLNRGDVDHVVALYKRGGCYGAISKTNHAVLRFRDPIYRTPRELALSYFHEWFVNETREKTLECYSKPFDLRRFGTAWLTAPEELYTVVDALSERTHYYLVPKGHWRYVRKADAMELAAGTPIEWKKSDPRT